MVEKFLLAGRSWETDGTTIHPKLARSALLGTHVYGAGRVVSHQTVKALTASEYGPGGDGLAEGTYMTRVWANGAPSAPPGSPVTVSLQG